MRTALSQLRAACLWALLYLTMASFTASSGDRYEIHFTKIDNQVVVTQLGQEKEVVFDSGVIHYNPDLNIRINITPFVQENNGHFLVEGYNAPWTNGSPWEFRYELLRNGQVIETVHVVSSCKHCPAAKVLEREHVLSGTP